MHLYEIQLSYLLAHHRAAAPCPLQTNGPSMMPTLNEMGDIVLVDKLSPRWRPIQRNEVVIADSSYKRDFAICKRVIGLPGDIIHPPRAAQRLYHTPSRSIVVPPGHVWLEGDNPQNSIDSRHYGPVPAALIRGRVCAKLWPLTEAGAFDTRSPRPTENTLYRSALMADSDIIADAQRRWSERQAALAARAAAEAEEEARLQRLLRTAVAGEATVDAGAGGSSAANVETTPASGISGAGRQHGMAAGTLTAHALQATAEAAVSHARHAVEAVAASFSGNASEHCGAADASRAEPPFSVTQPTARTVLRVTQEVLSASESER